MERENQRQKPNPSRTRLRLLTPAFRFIRFTYHRSNICYLVHYTRLTAAFIFDAFYTSVSQQQYLVRILLVTLHVSQQLQLVSAMVFLGPQRGLWVGIAAKPVPSSSASSWRDRPFVVKLSQHTWCRQTDTEDVSWPFFGACMISIVGPGRSANRNTHSLKGTGYLEIHIWGFEKAGLEGGEGGGGKRKRQ